MASRMPGVGRVTVSDRRSMSDISLSVPAKEFENLLIEEIWLFPVDGVAGLRHDHGCRVPDPRSEEAKDSRRRIEISIPGHQQRWYGDRFQQRERQPVAERLHRGRWPFRSALLLELQPSRGATRIGSPVRRTQLANIRRECVELRRPQSPSDLEVILVLDSSDAVGHYQASQPLRKRHSKVQGDDPTRRRSDEVKTIQPQVIDESQKIVGAGTRLRPARLRYRLTEAAPVVRNHSIAGRRERGHLIFPDAAASGGSMAEDHGHSPAAGVGVRETDARQIGPGPALWILECRCRKNERRQSHDGCDDRSAQPGSCSMCSVDFWFSLQMNSIIDDVKARS